MAKDEPTPEPVTWTPITNWTPELLEQMVNVQSSTGGLAWDPGYADNWIAAREGRPVEPTADPAAAVVDPPAVNPPSP